MGEGAITTLRGSGLNEKITADQSNANGAMTTDREVKAPEWKGRSVKYKYEEKVKALEDEVEALKLRLRAAQAKRGAGGGDGQSSAVQAEEMYRRARTEVAAEAGAGYGRVSLEALYLLPAEFTNAYQRLFLAALKESPGQTGEANPLVKKAPKLLRRGPGHENQRIAVRDKITGEVTGFDVAEVLDRDPDRGGGAARSGGKRHRDHWLVKDERAFRLKKTVDDQLRELAEVLAKSLSSPSSSFSPSSRAAGKSSRLIQSDGDDATTGNGGTPAVPTCSGCRKFLKATWRFCPHCGTGVSSSSG